MMQFNVVCTKTNIYYVDMTPAPPVGFNVTFICNEDKVCSIGQVYKHISCVHQIYSIQYSIFVYICLQRNIQIINLLSILLCNAL